MLDIDDLTGQKYGRLTVLQPAQPHFYQCRCDCGNIVTLRDTLLTSGFLHSCGCARGDGRKKDVTGIRSGKIVALEPTQKRRSGAVLWRCRCDCGRELLTVGHNITSGAVKSCGCTRRSAPLDLTNQRFGLLTALERVEKKRRNSYLWRCRCDCGNETEVSAKALRGGETKSCGCIRQEISKHRAADIKGQRFGRLVALEPLEKRMGGSVVWRCQCDCGNETEVSCNSLVQGNTKSCGCLRRENKKLTDSLCYVNGTCVELVENQKIRKNNTSGYTGVVSYRGRWRAQITFKRKAYNLGTYDHIEDAAEARKEAEGQLFGTFLDWYHNNYP